MASTIIVPDVWETRLAQRLDKPQTWKDTADVMYTNSGTIVLPYVSTSNEPSTSATITTQAGRSTLSNVVPFASVTEATETLQVISTDFIQSYLDYADQAQSPLASQAVHADLLSKKVNERVETIVLAGHADWTNLGDDGSGNVALADTALTVTSTNVDDICRGVIEQVITANGGDLLLENGGFITWRAADKTKLDTFCQANGFTFADEALKDPNKKGQIALGLHHYVSTSHASGGHLFGGVRQAYKLGLNANTFGKVFTVEHPSSSTAGFLSGTSVYFRIDYGRKMQTNLLPVVFDIRVV